MLPRWAIGLLILFAFSSCRKEKIEEVQSPRPDESEIIEEISHPDFVYRSSFDSTTLDNYLWRSSSSFSHEWRKPHNDSIWGCYGYALMAPESPGLKKGIWIKNYIYMRSCSVGNKKQFLERLFEPLSDSGRFSKISLCIKRVKYVKQNTGLATILIYWNKKKYLLKLPNSFSERAEFDLDIELQNHELNKRVQGLVKINDEVFPYTNVNQEVVFKSSFGIRFECDIIGDNEELHKSMLSLEEMELQVWL